MPQHIPARLAPCQWHRYCTFPGSRPDGVTRMNWALTDVNMEIVLATLGSDAGTIGAAGVAWQAIRHTRA